MKLVAFANADYALSTHRANPRQILVNPAYISRVRYHSNEVTTLVFPSNGEEQESYELVVGSVEDVRVKLDEAQDELVDALDRLSEGVAGIVRAINQYPAP